MIIFKAYISGIKFDCLAKMGLSTLQVIALGCLYFLAIASSSASVDLIEQEPKTEHCLGCHGIVEFSVDAPDGSEKKLHVNRIAYAEGVHQIFDCVDCHTAIDQIPHGTVQQEKVDCVNCHQQTWEDAKASGITDEYPSLAKVVKQFPLYDNSIHAQPNRNEPSRPNAYCSDCHNTHYLTPINSERGDSGRLKVPDVCGECHDSQLAEYADSIHGQEVLVKGNANAAVCIDCHTTHAIEKTQGDSAQLSIGKNCGNCHAENMKTYRQTYHGQVNTLGETQTAKCYDCHGSHDVKRIDDPSSTMHVNNRLETCSTCHEGASDGFVTFLPHANTHDFERYPEMYIVSKFMIWLLVAVFTFFYIHSALWFYAEYRDRKKNRAMPHLDASKLSEDCPQGEKYVKRFAPLWRLAHLTLALGVMMLVITGMALLFAESFWAPIVIQLLGGVEIAGIIHRTGALMFIGVFFAHLLYVFYYIVTNWKTWKWFGPNSLLPNLQDLRGLIGMFKWFFGKGPRPIFDRWAYWEKFDYWAPFWGLTIVGISGAMLWLPELTSHYLPGWVFNVGTIIHGEEAFLAAVFLFTVHFFNCHFRPDKFPQDISIFTGSVPLHEFKHERKLEYQRLVESGELEKYLVDAPSKSMTSSSKILGATLIIIGLIELILVLNGFFGSH